MSYTLTLDMPERTTAYVMRRGRRLRDELNALALAFISTQMQYEPLETADAGWIGDAIADGDGVRKARTGADFARAWGRIGLKDGELDLSRRPENLREIDIT